MVFTRSSRVCYQDQHLFWNMKVRDQGAVVVELHTIESANVAPNDTCVISQDTFSTIERCEDTSECFIKNVPKVCIGKLPCGHAFGLIPLTHHFVMCDQRCPLCRQGPSIPCSVDCVPIHIRAKMQMMLDERSERILREERENDRRAWAAAMHGVAIVQIRSPATIHMTSVYASMEMQLVSSEDHIICSYTATATSVFANRARFENLAASFGPALRQYSVSAHNHVRFVLWVTQGLVTSSYDMSGVQIMSVLMSGSNAPVTVFLPLQPVHL